MNSISERFDAVIGYDSIKTELYRVVDMVLNPEVYTGLGARLPKGILLHGNPGMGKTLMANCFIEACGLPVFTIRRNKSAEFAEVITEAFEKAREAAPSIVFLDDMDKYANEDSHHVNAPEYIAVQSGIDSVRNSKVIVIATANDLEYLPDSLLRPGRFDERFEIDSPDADDAEKIVQYYLSDKDLADDVNKKDIAKMVSYHSCAQLETILNEAAISAAFARKTNIDTDDLVSAVLNIEYGSPKDLTNADSENLARIAIHEAGHLVAAEVLQDESIGFASARPRGNVGGFVHRCKPIKRRPFDVIVALAGKLAAELYFPETVDSGTFSDIERAYYDVRVGVSESGTMGLSLIDAGGNYPDSQLYRAKAEIVTHAELERFAMKTRELLIRNREFLEKVRDALIEKHVLLFSDIQEIKATCEIHRVSGI